ncbi:type II toxin-antitoxin system VapC family toxin [Actinophytocola sp.]|uniref:type II toxin-antitoxin system VapC family toxin n=1 Tax=Actinophytocola sp. TaxID=1872138 RepID=UPI002D7F5DC3|nr:type II toxin-antitoxin system VapC family toxin [Actinophytocola sp.]HET9143542.1 type II toxin-antitoxin system VapC family toxin [Actinophytocola sp.]
MRLLLDTQVLLWWLFADRRLGADATQAITNADNDVLVSAVSAFEICTKQAIGKVQAPDDLEQQLMASSFQELPVTMAHSFEVRSLPMHHKDPFDRILVAQARFEDLTLLTSDRMLRAYDVRTMPAG